MSHSSQARSPENRRLSPRRRILTGISIVAVLTLLYHIGGDTWNLAEGFRALGQLVPEMTTLSGYVSTGYEPAAVEARIYDTWDKAGAFRAGAGAAPAARARQPAESRSTTCCARSSPMVAASWGRCSSK